MTKKIKLGLLLPFAISFLLIFKPPVDTDLGWHVRWGEYIVETKNFPVGTIFSYNLQDAEVVDFYWLSEVLIYLIYEYLGIVFVSFFFTFFSAAAVLFLVNSERSSVFSKCFMAAVISILFSTFLLSSRIIALSTFFFSLLFILLKDFWNGRSVRNMVIIPFLFWVWANIHPEFFFGLLFLLAFLLMESSILLFRRAGFIKNISEDYGFSSKNDIRILGAVFVISVLATFLNPYGMQIHESILLDANAAHLANITEWTPLAFGTPAFRFYILYSSLILFLFLVNGKNRRFRELLIIAAAWGLSLRFSYAARLLVIFSAPFILRNLSIKSIFGSSSSVFQKFKVPRIYISFFIIPISLYFLVNVIKTLKFNETLKEYNFPVEAVNFISRNRDLFDYEENVFNAYEWGGYLIWRMPDREVFIYGQMPSWRVSGIRDRIFLQDYMDIKYISENFSDLVSKYEIEWFLIPSNGGLADYLSDDPRFAEVYRDTTAVIFKKEYNGNSGDVRQ